MVLSGANNENSQDYNLPDTQYKEIIYHVHGAITAGLVRKQRFKMQGYCKVLLTDLILHILK